MFISPFISLAESVKVCASIPDEFSAVPGHCKGWQFRLNDRHRLLTVAVIIAGELFGGCLVTVLVEEGKGNQCNVEL